MTDGNNEPNLKHLSTEAANQTADVLPTREKESNELKPALDLEPTKTTPKTDGEKTKFALPRFRKAPPQIPQMRDAVTVKIEKILESGIGDAYARLSPVAKQEFKLKGEETARKINELLKSAHYKVKKIFQLVLEWLKMLPGVNKFFLEQEAKIKTDRITSLKEKN